MLAVWTDRISASTVQDHVSDEEPNGSLYSACDCILLHIMYNRNIMFVHCN